MRRNCVYVLLGVLVLTSPAAAQLDELAPISARPAPSSSPTGAFGPRCQVGVDFLNWWLREGRMPAALTTSSQDSRGLIGQPDTRILYGNQRLPTRHGDQFAGVRTSMNYWFDDEHSLGFEASGFSLERDSTHFKAVSDGSVLLARPFLNPDGSQASRIVAGIGALGPRDGQFVGYSRVELFGEEGNLVAPVLVGDNFRLDFLGGARFLQMRDRTDLTSTGHLLPNQDVLFGLEDHYRADNAYYGGQIGLRGEVVYRRWSFLMRSTIGLGANDEEIRTYGYRLLQTPDARVVTPAGLTVQGNNTGTFHHTSLNMVTSVGLNVSYKLTRRIQIFGGYSFLLWDGPIRSGDQIDLVVRRDPGTPQVRPAFKEDVFWAQGINVGMMFGW